MFVLEKILGRVLLLVGALFFVCWGYLILHALWFQRASSRVLERQMSNARAAIEHITAPYELLAPPHHGEIIGRLEIPRMDVSVMVLEGTDPKILDVAAGHVEGTA